jgi:hypothetical protein
MMTLVFLRMPAASRAWMTPFIWVMVVVSKAERATIVPSVSLAAWTNLSAGTSTPRSITWNPPPSSIEATRFLPMSCRSPWTVPMTTRPGALAPASASLGVSSLSAVFMARAAMSNSGTKYSLHSNRLPTSSMAGIMYLESNSEGSTLASKAALVTSSAFFALPVKMAS